MHGNDSPYSLCYTYTWRLTVPIIYTYKRSALEVDDGEVHQRLMYERKESIGSNVLHTLGVQLSLEISGGITQICKKEDHQDSIPMDWIVIGRRVCLEKQPT